MKLLLLAAAIAGAAPQSSGPLSEAAHAIAAGRLEQARLMIGAAIRAGAKGQAVDRLLADLAFGTGDFATALPRYEALLAATPTDPYFAERAGLAAVRTNNLARAALLLDRATGSPSASWQAWNARGVVADRAGDWNLADAAYSRALELKPGRAEVLNNLGWSLLVRGRWIEAAAQLEDAAAADPKSSRIANNLELARAAVSEDLPLRRPNEDDGEWAARLNDAGVIAGIRGDNKRAVAAFAQAIEARSQWFERAANNLAHAQASP